MKYYLVALIIFSFLLLDKSFYLDSLLLCHTTFKTFFSTHGLCYVQLIFVVDYLKNPHNAYQKMENKLVSNFK